MAFFVVSSAACLDLTPTVVAESEASVEGSGTSQSCLACLFAPSDKGGCADEWVGCEGDAICKKGLDCAIRDACFSQSDQVLPVCSLHCSELAGFMSQGDLTTQLALAIYKCAVDKCHKKCQGDLEGGTGAEGGSDAGSPDASDAGGPGADASGGACANAADQATTMSSGFSTAPRDCGFMCFSMPDSSCAKDCIQKTGLSSACATCWGDAINCGAKNCLAECLDPSSTACTSCTTQHCDPAFRACSGT
jgi:hypothetical protein